MDQIEYLGYTGSVLGYNLYTYCEGNPIMYVDYGGTLIESIITFVVMVAFLIITIVSIEKTDFKEENKSAAAGFLYDNLSRPGISTISTGGSFGNYIAQEDIVGSMLGINSMR